MLAADKDGYDWRFCFRIPAGSFHASQHPAQFTWDTLLATTFRRKNLSQVTLMNNPGELREIPKAKRQRNCSHLIVKCSISDSVASILKKVKSISLYNIAGQ